MYQLPKVIDVDISFKPIMNDLPRRATSDGAGIRDSSSIIGRSEFNGAVKAENIRERIRLEDSGIETIESSQFPQTNPLQDLVNKQNLERENQAKATAAAAKKTTTPVANTKTTKKTKKKK